MRSRRFSPVRFSCGFVLVLLAAVIVAVSPLLLSLVVVLPMFCGLMLMDKEAMKL